MNKTLSRVLWIIAGVLLIVAGVYCFVSPEAALSGLSPYTWTGHALLRYR